MAPRGGQGKRKPAKRAPFLLRCLYLCMVFRAPAEHFGYGRALAVAGVVAAGVIAVRGAGVLLHVHDVRRSGGSLTPGAILRLVVTMPPVVLRSTPDAPGLLYRWRGHLRREGAERRDLEHHPGGRVTVTVLYKDSEGDPVPQVPAYCPGSFTVEVEGDVLISNRSHPPLLGDATTLWSTLVADAAAGDLTVLRREGDTCVVARVGFPRGARFAIVMAEPDWDLVLAAHPARPVASRASRP
ncbi:hypothetical protein [Terrabacter sp. 2YAF2]|uniref:hypothetical protein n=1 Tax=Terrabacter sp. 2YAF2 TaxID=3233026 RepID=UPI003F9D7201